ncbi:MAG: response regulator [Methylococcales bacterium]|nr:response regulator [Methylococcales bacterium]
MATILIVEDNEMNMDMLSRRLSRRGYEIIAATDGEQGIELAIKQLPDLILMDMSLPIINGWDATRKIKQHQPTSHIPVIALTAHAMESDRQEALSAGCNDYDTKPIEIERLLGKIAALLK